MDSLLNQNPDNCNADLHIHSNHSDGSHRIDEIIEISKNMGLKTISITDHDTVSGIPEALLIAQDSIEVIPAVEMSSNLGSMDVHILGYYIDCGRSEMLDYLDSFKQHRMERVMSIVKHLYEDGIKIEFERIKMLAGNCSLGRPHIAEVLIESGYVKTISEAFSRYLRQGQPYYEPKKNVAPKEVIKLIKECKGVPVIAHPGILHFESIIYQLIMDGCLGIEVWHPEHSMHDRQRFSEIAIKNGLIMTGGSDCHGQRGGNAQIGSIGCQEKDVIDLKNYHDRIALRDSPNN